MRALILFFVTACLVGVTCLAADNKQMFETGTLVANVEKSPPIKVIDRNGISTAFEWKKGLTAYAAVSRAKAIVWRNGRNKICVDRSGRKLTYLVDDILSGKIPDPLLRPGDVVTVPEVFFKL